MAELTEKQKAFCDYYIETLNATESYKRAYGSNNDNTAAKEGHKLLKNPKVTQEISNRMAEKEAKRIAKQDEVLEYLTSVMRGEIDEECVVVENTGDYCSQARIVNKQVTPKDRTKAAELLAKRYGLLDVEKGPEKVDVTVYVNALNGKAEEVWNDEEKD